MQNPAKAIVQCKYNMISFSVNDRKRPGPDRRSVEISKIISEAFEYVVFTENYPRTSIDVYIEVLQANAGTRCAGLTAASVALADAGIPMKDLIPSVAVGKVNDQIVLDLEQGGGQLRPGGPADRHDPPDRGGRPAADGRSPDQGGVRPGPGTGTSAPARQIYELQKDALARSVRHREGLRGGRRSLTPNRSAEA